jgi:acetyltransferase-like isoleucine patch superfamily enzyme
MGEARYSQDKVTVYPGVRLGKDVVIHDFCVIGLPPRGSQPGERETVIGDGAVIRPFTTIYGGVDIGKNFQAGQGVSIREDNVIGDDSSLGTQSILEIGNRIGNHVRIHSMSAMEHTTIEDHAMIGPNVLFLSDPHPPCPRYMECVLGPTVKRYARIGAGVIVSPGVTIGENCLIGSGAVVRKDIPPNSLALGSPARRRGRIEQLECFKGFYPRAYSWDPPELFDPSILPEPKE